MHEVFYFKKRRSLRNLKKLIPAMLLGLSCSAFAASNLIPPLMEQGMKNYTEKKYKAAADYLGQVVDIDPEHSQARYYLVYSLALSGNNELALKHAEILARKFPKDASYKTLVSQIKAELEKQPSNKIISSETSYTGNIKKEVMIGGYKSLDKNSEMREPKVDYTPRDITPPRPPTELEKAIMKIDEEKYDEAEKMLKALIEKNDKDAGAHHNLGVVYMSKNRYALAAKSFSTAAKLDDKEAFQSLFLLADCFRNMGEISKAEGALTKACELKEDEFALLNLAQTKIELGKYEEAENKLNRILQISPKFSEASIALAQIRIGQGKIEEALEKVNTALANGSKGEANYVKGLILLANNIPQEALEQFDLAMKTSPSNTKYILGRATAFLKLYDFPHAMDDAVAVLNINPNSIPAIFVKAEAFILSSSEDQAEEALDGIKSKSDFAEAHRLRGMIAKRRGDDKTAREEYDKYLKKSGGSPSAAFEYAEFLETVDGAKSDAISCYEAIIKKYPGSVYATRAEESKARLSSDSDSGISPDVAFDVNPAPVFDAAPRKNYRTGKMKY